jgi:hypothetical protein
MATNKIVKLVLLCLKKNNCQRFQTSRDFGSFHLNFVKKSYFIEKRFGTNNHETAGHTKSYQLSKTCAIWEVTSWLKDAAL